MNPQVFGKYQIFKRIAVGSTAEVWLARQGGIEGFSKNVVVKRLHSFFAEKTLFVEMFRNEALIAARFNHPNIAQVYEFGEANSTYFIAMEYIHGADLGQVMRKAYNAGGWIARPLAIRIMASVCEGLYYAHSRTDDAGRPLRVVHRDISPQNILISFDGSVKLVDFGIAKAADHASLTRSGAFKGKFAYMAPEQVAAKTLDHRADIFAAGLVLYELLTGTRPLKRGTELATLQAAMECNILPPSQVADVPPELDSMVMRALAREPDERYRDARQFQRELEEFLVGQRWVAGSVQLSELMEVLFAERLDEERMTGQPVSVEKEEGNVSSPVRAERVFSSRSSSELAPLFTWLHLSDIHVGYSGASHRWDQELVLDSLRRDVVAQRARGIPSPDAILVTGDVAFGGTSAQYKEAMRWLFGIAKAVGLDLRHVFTVPGNHDVDRAADKDRSVGRLVRTLREGSEALDDVLAHDEDRVLLSRRMAHYLDFSTKLAPVCVEDSDPAVSCFSWSYRLRMRDGLRVRLVGLNTALLAADDADRGKLRIGKESLARVFTRPPVESDEFVVVLTHHPLRDGWLADERDADAWIRKHAHVHLSGHVHEADLEEVRAGSGSSLVRMSAGAVHDRNHHGIPASYGYSFVSVLRGKDGLIRLRSWPRLWSEKKKDFRVDIHNVPEGAEYAEHSLDGVSGLFRSVVLRE